MCVCSVVETGDTQCCTRNYSTSSNTSSTSTPPPTVSRVWKISCWTTTIQQVFTPPKFNSSPLKIHGWKTTFLFGNVTFQGLCETSGSPYFLIKSLIFKIVFSHTKHDPGTTPIRGMRPPFLSRNTCWPIAYCDVGSGRSHSSSAIPAPDFHEGFPWDARWIYCIYIDPRKINHSCGRFLKWWYPQNTSKWSFLVGKRMVVGYQHFRKPPCR